MENLTIAYYDEDTNSLQLFDGLSGAVSGSAISVDAVTGSAISVGSVTGSAILLNAVTGYLIRLSNGTYVRLDADPSLGDDTVDTDGDGIPDIYELNAVRSLQNQVTSGKRCLRS